MIVTTLIVTNIIVINMIVSNLTRARGNVPSTAHRAHRGPIAALGHQSMLSLAGLRGRRTEAARDIAGSP